MKPEVQGIEDKDGLLTMHTILRIVCRHSLSGLGLIENLIFGESNLRGVGTDC